MPFSLWPGVDAWAEVDKFAMMYHEPYEATLDQFCKKWLKPSDDVAKAYPSMTPEEEQKVDQKMARRVTTWNTGSKVKQSVGLRGVMGALLQGPPDRVGYEMEEIWSLLAQQLLCSVSKWRRSFSGENGRLSDQEGHKTQASGVVYDERS